MMNADNTSETAGGVADFPSSDAATTAEGASTAAADFTAAAADHSAEDTGLPKRQAVTSPKDARKEPRFNVRWHGDAFIDGKNPYPCYVRNISQGGAAIFLDLNLEKLHFIDLHIHVPPLNIKIKPRIIEAQGRVVATVYDSHERMFRTSISFIKFGQESDSEFLKSRLIIQ